MFDKKISIKLIAGFVAIVLFSMVTIGIIFIELFKQYTFESREKIMLTRAHNIANVLSENLQINGQMRGFGGFMQFLDSLTEAKVYITDENGNPLKLTGMGMGMNGMVHLFSSDPIPDELKRVLKEVLLGKDSISQNFSSVYNESTLTVGVPIIDSNKQVLGTVFLDAPVTGITETLNKAIYILAVSLLVALILAIGLGILYSVLFTKPLKAMNNAAIEMIRGNYSVRTTINRKDELGQLSNSLDLLASKLEFTIDQLFQEKGKMNDIISSISEGIVAFDLELNHVSNNRSLLDILGISESTDIKVLKKVFSKLDIEASIKMVMLEKKPLQKVKDWENKKLKITLSPIIDNQSNVTGSVALIQDISESERLEQLRKDFVANVSHEFRTPLTVIRGSVEALIDGTIELKDDMERYHYRILSETKSLERLVRDLLELSRLQSGKISMNTETLHLPNLLSDTIKNLQTIADKKQIKIESAFPDAVLNVYGDYDRLRQLFIIFIDNAIKYSPEKTIIHVAIENNDNRLTVSIEDHGYGIPAEELPYIWDRFYKSDKSRKESGTGLGLAIAKHLIDLHNGEVEIQSIVGEGTKVQISFPVKGNQSIS